MSLEAFYTEVKGDYQAVKGRLQSDALITRLIIKFLNDPSYERLSCSVPEEDYDAAFMAAHSLKGVCQNLDFQILAESASEITELLRNRAEVPVDKERFGELYKKVEEDYRIVTDAVKKLAEQQ